MPHTVEDFDLYEELQHGSVIIETSLALVTLSPLPNTTLSANSSSVSNVIMTNKDADSPVMLKSCKRFLGPNVHLDVISDAGRVWHKGILSNWRRSRQSAYA